MEKKGQANTIAVVIFFVIGLIVFTALLPVITSQIDEINDNENVSASTKMIVTLYPLMIALILLVSLVIAISVFHGG